ncbi:MAG: ribosome recycling factor [Treponemataceae bacterium]|nr:ribosome recycling factor [Treponemataceae bacterium]
MSEVQNACEERMKKTIASLKDELGTIRTGRASTALFDRVRVDYYGEKSPLSQVATISIPEARMVVIQPWDKNLIKEIEKGILSADLGLNPSNDGKVIRISIPPLTADRRKELCKQAKNTAENSRVAIRNIRRDGNDELKKLQKDSQITEDDLKQGEDALQKSTDSYIQEINKILEAKEKEIMEG